jgi:hypothetical protein
MCVLSHFRTACGMYKELDLLTAVLLRWNFPENIAIIPGVNRIFREKIG